MLLEYIGVDLDQCDSGLLSTLPGKRATTFDQLNERLSWLGVVKCLPT
jgi:hypothetical protein